MQRHLLRIVTIMLAFLASFSLVQPGYSQDWSWNPFKESSASRDDSPIYNVAQTSSKSSWMPSWPKISNPFSKKSGPKVSSYSKSKTSTFNRMSKASKQWWNKTAELLDPYPDPKPSTYESLSKPDSKKGNWFTGMFQSDEPKKIETLPDWLRQETPKL
jgi:hypothetical protein